MIDVTMTSMLILCVAMILATLAFTAHEFRRVANSPRWRRPLALQGALEMSPVRVQTGRAR